MGSNRELYLGQCQPPQTKGHFISVVSCLTLCALFHTSSFIQRHCIGTDILGGRGGDKERGEKEKWKKEKKLKKKECCISANIH